MSGNIKFSFDNKTTAEEFIGTNKPQVQEAEGSPNQEEIVDVEKETIDARTSASGVIMSQKQLEEDESLSQTDDMMPDSDANEVRPTEGDDFIQRVQSAVNDSQLELSEEELKKDPTWLEANSILKTHLGDQLYSGDAYGMSLGSEMMGNLMGGVNMQPSSMRMSGGMAPIVASVLNSEDPKVINALLYNLEMYERKPMTTRGWAEGVKHLFGDVSNYVGLGLLVKAGNKALGKQGASRVSKVLLRSKLGKLVPNAVTATGMAEGAVFSATDSFMREYVEASSTDSGVMDISSIALAGGIGALAGGAIVKGVPYLVKIPATILKSSKATHKYIARGLERERAGDTFFGMAVEDDMAKLAGGGEAPKQHADKPTGTIEATPSSEVDYYGTIKDMTPDERVVFENAHLEPTNALMESFGLKGKISISKGAWEGQTNPNMLVEFDEGSDAKVIDDFLAKFGEDTEQDAVAWYQPKFKGDGDEPHLAIELAGDVDEASWSAFYKELRDQVGDDLTPVLRDGELHIMNYGGMDEAKVTEVLANTKALNDKLGKSVERFSADGNYISKEDYGNYTNKKRDEGQQGLQEQSNRGDDFKAEVKRVRVNAKVAPLLREAEGLEGNALNKKLNSLDMRQLTPENKQKVIEFRQSKSKGKSKPPKVQKAIKVNEEFNTNIYSVVENEIAHLESNKVYTPKELTKIFANATDNELVGSGIKPLMKSDVTGGALQDAITARPDKINKVEYRSGEDGIGRTEETLDRVDYESEWISEGDWENTPNWVESESGMGYRMTDDYTGEDSYITQAYYEDYYVDGDGYGVGDYNDMITKYYDEDVKMSDYSDKIMDIARDDIVEASEIASGTQRLLDLEIDRIDRILARGDAPEGMQKTRGDMETLSAKLDDMIDNDKEVEWLEIVNEFDSDYVNEGARNNDTVKDAITEAFTDEGLQYDMYNNKTYYTAGESNYDNFDEAKNGLISNMYEDYTLRMEDDLYGGNVDIHEQYTIDGGEDYRVKIYEMPNMKHADNKSEYFESHWEDTKQGGKNVVVHSRLKDRTDGDGQVGVVSEEIQSQARQSFDETGGRGVQISDERSDELYKKRAILTSEARSLDEANQPTLDALGKTREEMIDARRDYNKNIREEAVRLKTIVDESANAMNVLRTSSRTEELTDVDAVSMKAELDSLHTRETKAINDFEKLRDGVTSDPKVMEIAERLKPLRIADSEHTIEMGRLHEQISRVDDELKGTPPSRYNEPPMESQNYEKMVTYDNIMGAIDDGADFYGSNNGQVSNGWDVSRRGEIGGMVNAYNHRIPKEIEKITGEKPYVAYFSGNQADEANRKYWVPESEVPQTLKTKNGKPLSNYSQHYNESPKDWYWRVDLTDKVKAKLKDSKMPLYGIGAGAVIGAGQDNEEEIK